MTQTSEPTPPLDSLPKRKAFDAHLDECKRCEQNPMGLCPIGGPLLREAALEAANELGDTSMVEAFRKTNAQVDEAMEQMKKSGGARTEVEVTVNTDLKMKRFDEHFDECEDCVDSRSNVCLEGLMLLREAAVEAVESMNTNDLFIIIDMNGKSKRI